jgi:hypothetical protein
LMARHFHLHLNFDSSIKLKLCDSSRQSESSTQRDSYVIMASLISGTQRKRPGANFPSSNAVSRLSCKHFAADESDE